MTIIDSHLHLWNRIDGDIGERVRSAENGKIIVGNREILGMPPFLIDGRCPCEVALSVMNAAGVEAGVVTQEYLDGNQNEYLAEVQTRYPDRFFVHGLLDFRKPDNLASEFKDAVRRYGFRGIKLPARYLTKTKPRILLTDRSLMAVFEQMEKRQMVLSANLDYGENQVKEMREVARAFPGLTIVVEHFAMTGRPDWRRQVLLAREPNVYVESGGIVWLFRHDNPPFPLAQLAVQEAVTLVGHEKLMWGSDFPRTMIDFTYEQSLDFLLIGCKFLAEAQKESILGGTAMKIYGFRKPPTERSRLTRVTELD